MKPENCRIFNSPSQISLNPQSDEVIAPKLTVGTSDYRFDLPEKNGLIMYQAIYTESASNNTTNATK